MTDTKSTIHSTQEDGAAQRGPTDPLPNSLNAQAGEVTFEADPPLPLDCGVHLSPYTVASATFGKLNKARTNLVV